MKNIIFLFLISQAIFSQDITPLNYKISDVRGKTITLSEIKKDGPMFLTFWALWCSPCKSELNAFKKINDTLLNIGAKIVAINIDSPKSSAKVRAFVEAQKFPFTVLVDPNSVLFEMLNGQQLPHSILFDAKGNIVEIKNSFTPGDEKFIVEKIYNLVLETK